MTTGTTAVPASPQAGSREPVVTDHVTDGPHGDLRVRVYEPAPGVERRAGLVWAHGGAFMHGDLDMHEADGVARSLARHGVVVASVDYRLCPPIDYRAPGAAAAQAPDAVRFPVASEELTSAFGWARDAGFGVVPERWSIGGASAGGNLAAGVSLRLRDAGGPQPRSVVLAYPVAHDGLPEPRPELAAKLATLAPERNFPPEAVRALNANYLGHEGPATSPYAFPGGQDLRGLPPTFVLNSDHDALRSSGEAYAAELAAAGVDVLLVREDGTYHGHLNQPDDPGCARSLARIAAWLTTDALVGTAHEPPTA
ncbi:alpha/beta hydrolase [Isoptericola variabilis]|uniref:alpha/beta hydrolase n=1 Tax=Isoptericola variabilis TaxID=139208 RepID=UPI0002DFF51D|nr:alpha/beta hydrolase fold domain-containing protein [Isoptericola variabilis]